jgi:hypothetical protein
MTNAAAFASPAAERFQIGDVVSQTFAVVGRKLQILLLLALICLILPPLLAGVLEISSYDLSRPATSFMDALRGANAARGQVNPLINYPLSVLTFIGSFYFVIFTTQIVVTDLAGDSPQKDRFTLAWRRFLPYVGVLLLVTLATMAGFIFLIVPGIMIAIAFAVAMPVIISEPGRGVMGALRRSRDLTRGYRWRIFLLGLLYFVASAMVLAISVLSEVSLHLPIAIWGLTFGLLVSVAGNLFTAVGVAVLYFELRKAKDGGSASDVAAAFT